MGISHYAVLLVLTLGAVEAARTKQAETEIRQREVASDNSTAGRGTMCDLKESADALGYGIHGKFPVDSCMLSCKWNVFYTETLPEKILKTPDQEDNKCKCNYAPRYWEGESSKKFWFQYRVNSRRPCTLKDCKDVFLTWGNMFLKQLHSPGSRMEQSKRIESHGNYEMTCADGMPEGIVLPSPGDKIIELRLKIASTDDPDEKAKLQALLDELLGSKEIEIFSYDLEGDWGEEHHADSSAGDLHSYYLRPCKSNLGNVVTDLHEIRQMCGPGVMGESMKEGKLRYHYKEDQPWGPEQVCNIDAEKCKMLEDQAAADGWKLLSFRLKPCMTPSNEKELTDLSEVLAEEHCSKPTLGVSLLPVKVSASHRFDEFAPPDELQFPCA